VSPFSLVQLVKSKSAYQFGPLTSVARRYMANRSGQTAIEYCLIACLVGLFVMAGAGGRDGALTSPFDRIAMALAGGPGGQHAVNSSIFDDEMDQ